MTLYSQTISSKLHLHFRKKAFEEICVLVVCPPLIRYYQCLAADGNTFPEYRDNIQGYVLAAAVNYNQGNSGYRPLSVANQLRPPGFAQPNVQNNQNRFSQPQGYNQGNTFNQDKSYQALTQQNQVVPLSELEKFKKTNEANMKAMQNQINNVKNELRNEMQTSIKASMLNQTNELKNMMASFFQMKLRLFYLRHYSLEEFADELAHFTFPPGIDYLPFDAESDLREIEYLLNHDPIEEMDSILEDSVDKNSPNDNLVDTLSEIDLLPSPECDSVLYEDFSEVDALPSTNNVDKISISNASLILEDFNPPLNTDPFHKEIARVRNSTPRFHPKNEEKLSNLGINSLLKEFILLSSGNYLIGSPKAIKVIKILKALMENFSLLK
ncbi:hypothetical protein Tco_0282740 [Tanacetum coccineum]